MRSPVYNSRILSIRYIRIFVAVFMLWHGVRAYADDLSTLADKFAEKIVSVTGPEALAVEVTNQSSLSAAEADGVKRALLSSLTSFGARVSGDQKVLVRVSLSEDPRSYVWIAEVKQGNESSVTMISSPRLKFNVSPLEGTALAIRKTLLWSSEDRILDVAEVSEGGLLVLYPEQLMVYKSQAGKLQAEQSFAVTHLGPWPRDVRGRLIPRKDHLFDAYLPGVFCQSSRTTTMSCRQSDDPWPIGNEQAPLSGFFAATRNFFTGALSPGAEKQRSTAAFYSAAQAPSVWLFASVDGKVRVLDGTNEQMLNLGWGSDIAAIHSGCGSGSQILATDSDGAVRAYEMSGREPVPATQPIALGDGVSALWTAADGRNVIAVSRNRESGAYEAFRLTVTCGQ